MKPIKNSKRHYIFVVGGVISGVGKGVASSSIAKILQDKGYIVTAIKIDPYVNLDAGTMNPTEHGEVFVLDDRDECDQDMGNYERFLNITLTSDNYMTTGRVYKSVIDQERALAYEGKCVEVVPHIPLEVIRRIEKVADDSDSDVCLIEIGGTVGEYQNMLFLEAARMMKIKYGDAVRYVLVSYLPVPSKVGEMKTKPTQNAVKALNASGILPDVLIARSVDALDNKRKEKISFFCNIPDDQIISAPDVDSIYDVPINFGKEKLADKFINLLKLKRKSPKPEFTRQWKRFVASIHNPKSQIEVAVIGKYFDTGNYVLSDAYLSVIEAIKFSGARENVQVNLTWINSSDLEKKNYNLKDLKRYAGIIVPGGFGKRGIEGKISAINFARKNKIPYLGLCYGMQLMLVEYARNVLGFADANTTEVTTKTKHPVINIQESQKGNVAGANMGNTMRLGAYECKISKETLAYEIYRRENISERHRHRYEVNEKFISDFEKKGIVFSGKSPDGHLMEICELPKSKHPFFVGVQFHPEFLARPLAPHPLFTAFVKACKK